jgi:hypothetical protein
MKEGELLGMLKKQGCVFIKHGKKHDTEFWHRPARGDGDTALFFQPPLAARK